MPNQHRCSVVAVLLGLALAAPAMADRVVLVNGDRLTGRVVTKQGDRLQFQTRYAGELSLAWDQVRSLDTDTPVELVLGDGRWLEAELRAIDGQHLVVVSGESGESASEPLALARIAYINAPPEVTGRGASWSGRLSAGLSASQGNSTTRDLYLEAETVRRSRHDRLTAGGRLQYSRDDGTESADSTTLKVQYDRFLDPRRYGYLNAAFTRDPFRELELRSAFGVGYGHQLIESEARALSLEGGVTYVVEDLTGGGDGEHVAGRWAVNYRQALLDRRLRFFHRHQGLANLDATDDIVIESQTGLSFPWTPELSGTLQLNADWDGDPAPGTESTDLTYLFNLGYSW